MKAKDLERFKVPFKVELGKIDIYGCGRKENRVVLEFNLFSSTGREPGEEYISPINLSVYQRGKHHTKLIMSVSPSKEHLPKLIICGLNALYEPYLKTANELVMKHWLKYTRLIPSTDVAAIIDNLLMVETIANNNK